jgi:hypothetical protein
MPETIRTFAAANRVIINSRDNGHNIMVTAAPYQVPSQKYLRKSVTIAVRNPSRAEEIGSKSDATCAKFNPYFRPSS